MDQPPETRISRPVGGIVCPRCGGASVPIAYGLPDPSLFEAADRGEVALGGCCVSSDSPDRRCRACGHGWSSGRPLSFDDDRWPQVDDRG